MFDVNKSDVKEIILRGFGIAKNCTSRAPLNYNSPNNYRDIKLSPVQSPTLFRRDSAQYPTRDSTVTLVSNHFKVKFCERTGTIYEFFNYNATSPNGKELNIIHSHIGAAFQIATHHGQLGSLTPQACAGGGYWNPTQAGAICGYLGNALLSNIVPNASQSGLRLFCDNQESNFVTRPCRSFQNLAKWQSFRLANFDYGPSYLGPFHAKDQFYLEQEVYHGNTFLELNYSIKSNVDMVRGVIELPTLYLASKFTSIQYGKNNQIFNIGFAKDPLTTFDISTIPRIELPEDYDWISFTMNSAQYGSQTLTLATFLAPEFESLITRNIGQNPKISITDLYRRVKYGYNRVIKYPVGQVLKAWHLTIPQGPNTIIATPFGQLTVQAFLQRAKSHYNSTKNSLRTVSVSPNPTPLPNPTPTPTPIPTPANLLNNAQFISQNVPTSMMPGQSYNVGLTFKNTGTSTWTAANLFGLGSPSSQNNAQWGISYVSSGSNAIVPGQTKVFNFTVKAPSTVGYYPFQWQMVKGSTEWFGAKSTLRNIEVKNSSTNNQFYYFTSITSTSVFNTSLSPSKAIDNDPNTFYSSAQFTTAYPPANSLHFEAYLPAYRQVRYLVITARMHPTTKVPMGFPQSYRIYVTNSNNLRVSAIYYPVPLNS